MTMEFRISVSVSLPIRATMVWTAQPISATWTRSYAPTTSTRGSARSGASAEGAEYGLFLRDLGQVYAAQRNFSDAETALGQSVSILERELGANDARLVETRASYETVRRARGAEQDSGI